MCAGCGGNSTIDRLRSGTPEQRAEAAAFLGAQRVTEAIPALREALKDTSEDVRAKSAWALGAMRSKDALPDLLRLVESDSRRVRQQAVQAVAEIEEPGAIPTLEAALAREDDPWIRKDLEAALEYLGQFEGEADVSEGGFR